MAGFEDGIHPSEQGWEVLTDHMFDQELDNLMQGFDWVP